jgi:hypothetical protein
MPRGQRDLQHRSDVDPDRIGGIGLSVGGEMMIEAAAESTALKGDRLRRRKRTLAQRRPREPRRGQADLIGTALITVATSLFTSNTPPADLKSLVAKIGPPHLGVLRLRREGPAHRGARQPQLLPRRQGPEGDLGSAGSRHMGGIDAQPAAYERRVVGFFDRALLDD